VNQQDFVSDIQTPSRAWFSMGVSSHAWIFGRINAGAKYRYYGRGGWASFARPKYIGRSDRQTFQSLINISFPKIVGERGEGEISGHTAFFTNFRNNLPWFVKFFSNIFVNVS
jgi:hypothetical protein